MQSRSSFFGIFLSSCIQSGFSYSSMILQYGADRVTKVHFWLGDTQGDVGFLIVTIHTLTISISQSSTVYRVLNRSVSKRFFQLWQGGNQTIPPDQTWSVCARTKKDSPVGINPEQTPTLEDGHLLWPAGMKRKYKWGRDRDRVADRSGRVAAGMFRVIYKVIIAY